MACGNAFFLVGVALAIGCEAHPPNVDTIFLCPPHCLEDAASSDAQFNESGAGVEGGDCSGQCAAGEICAYNAGCNPPTKACHIDTGGDAVALLYCGCDGQEFTTSQLFPTQSYERTGSCTSDGSADAPDE